MNDNNQVNENPDLEKTQVISNDDINLAMEQQVQAPVQEAVTTEPVQAPVQEAVAVEPVQAPVQEAVTTEPVQAPVQEAVAAEPVQAPVQEPVATEPVQASVQENVEPSVVDQAVVENISSTTVSDNSEVQNIVDNSSTQTESTVKKVDTNEVQTSKGPSKLSTVLVILLFIFLFVFLFEMPKITEWIENKKQDSELSDIERQAKLIEEQNKKKEEEAKKAREEAKREQEEKEAAIKKMTCKVKSPATDLVTYSQTVVETFDYNEKSKKVVSSSQITIYNFKEQDENYTKIKTECENDSTKFLGKPGYTMSCSSDDLSITIENEFDLEKYETIKDGNVSIVANAEKYENVDNVKNRLTALGYTCK